MFNVFTLATVFHRVTDLYRSKLNERHFSLETVISILQSFPFFFSLPDAPISTVRYWYPLFSLFVFYFLLFCIYGYFLISLRLLCFKALVPKRLNFFISPLFSLFLKTPQIFLKMKVFHLHFFQLNSAV